jgi:hypothetical protein
MSIKDIQFLKPFLVPLFFIDFDYSLDPLNILIVCPLRFIGLSAVIKFSSNRFRMISILAGM